MMSIHRKATLEERVNTACQRLLAIEAAAAVEEDVIFADADDRFAAIQELAHEAMEVLAPLKNAPFAVTEWTAPDDTADDDPTPPRTNGGTMRIVPSPAPAA